MSTLSVQEQASNFIKAKKAYSEDEFLKWLKGLPEKVSYLRDYKYDNCKHGSYPLLQFAAQQGKNKVLALLKEEGADSTQVNEWGSTAVHSAAFQGNAAALLILVPSQMEAANQGVGKYDNSTPLHFAALTEHAECVRILLAAGADPNARAKYFYSNGYVLVTPLQSAASYGNPECVRALLEGVGGRRADKSLHNMQGKTALDMAKEARERGTKGAAECIRLLEQEENLWKEGEVVIATEAHVRAAIEAREKAQSVKEEREFKPHSYLFELKDRQSMRTPVDSLELFKDGIENDDL